MASIKRFEEIKAWQKARELVNAVYAVTREGAFARDFGLRDQIRRAAGTIMHNIAEGFDSGTDAEFRRFLRISARSASEVQSQLYTAIDQGYLIQAQFNLLYEQTEAVKAHIRKFIKYLSASNGNGIREQREDYFVSGDIETLATLDVGRRTE
jgi:four helix bundle protein